MQLWHVVEVHAIDAGDEGERRKDRRHNREGLHDLVHAITRAGHVRLGDGIALMPQDFAAVEDLINVLGHLLKSQQAVGAHHRLVLAQKQKNLMAQRPELLADAAQVGSELISAGEHPRPRVAQSGLLEIIEAVGHLLEHWENAIKDVVHHVVEQIIEIVGPGDRCFVQQPVGE